VKLALDDRRYLRRKSVPPPIAEPRGTLRVADLFCGCGGMSLGLREAARRAGLSMEIVLALDLDPDAVAVFAKNLGNAEIGKIEGYFDGDVASDSLTSRERYVRLIATRVCTGA
jgi:DNA (cytosine-5)-methyltransferase 1